MRQHYAREIKIMEINDDLVKQWNPKIQKMVSNSFILGLDKEDLAQELRISLVKAAKAFDETRGISFHTYLHTSLVNTIRTLISKAQRQLDQRSLDRVFPESGQLPQSIAQALIDEKPENLISEIEADLFIDAQGLTDKEKMFVKLKLEGLTMEEISEDLGESAYKVRHTLREKFDNLDDDFLRHN